MRLISLNPVCTLKLYPFKLQLKRVFTWSKGQVMPELTSIDYDWNKLTSNYLFCRPWCFLTFFDVYWRFSKYFENWRNFIKSAIESHPTSMAFIFLNLSQKTLIDIYWGIRTPLATDSIDTINKMPI